MEMIASMNRIAHYSFSESNLFGFNDTMNVND